MMVEVLLTTEAFVAMVSTAQVLMARNVVVTSG